MAIKKAATRERCGFYHVGFYHVVFLLSAFGI